MEFFFGLNANTLAGAGVAERLGRILRERSLSRTMLIYDTNAARTGAFGDIKRILQEDGIECLAYPLKEPDTTQAGVAEAVQFLVDQNIQALLALGDGVTINHAKAVNILLNNQGVLSDFNGVNRVPNLGLPLIALPIATGDGSEVTSLCLITGDEPTDDYVIAGQNVAPSLALADPRLMRDVDPDSIAMTGMGALARAVEAYLSAVASPFSDALAVCAVKLITDNLEKAVADAIDTDACTALLAGGMSAGMAFSNTQSAKGPTPGHYLSVYRKISLALANAIILPYIMESRLETQTAKLLQLALNMGLRVENLPESEAAALAVKRVREISKNIGIPSIKELEINEDFVLKLISAHL